MLRSQGIGGYELVYSLVFLCIILFFILVNLKLIKKSMIGPSSVVFILFFLTIIFANYFTALLILTLAFATITLMKKWNMLVKFFLIVLGFIVLVFSKDILILITNWFISFLGNGSTVDKLLILQSNILGYGGVDNVALNRAMTIETSWHAFLQSPIFGIVIDSIEQTGGFLSGFGQHSYIMDTFALYGLFIGILNIYILTQPFLVRMERGNVLVGLNFSVLMSTLILFFMNNATPSIGFAIYFIYPFFYNWLSTIQLTKVQ
ncbi:hypothetical protein FS935_21015 [Metabacillus litoralis]|uniref:O-antigen ligase family protein n=2 Tax=Metabacillus litoralis TaxID=152268 RepID=A0A5C6V9K5_9BACI|nr:hypothetical protein FS935_21015 [Metabacillus litoralis]